MESMQRWNHLTQAAGSCVRGRTELTTKPRSFVPAKKKPPIKQSINQNQSIFYLEKDPD